jgi:hypothetical protein
MSVVRSSSVRIAGVTVLCARSVVWQDLARSDMPSEAVFERDLCGGTGELRLSPGDVAVFRGDQKHSYATPPTVLRVTDEDTLMREETFGPLLPIVIEEGEEGEEDAIGRTTGPKTAVGYSVVVLSRIG